MSPDQTAWLTFLGGLLMAIASLGGVIYTARTAKKSTDQASQVELISTLMGRIQTLEEGQRNLWAELEKAALVKRAQGDHIDVLENHIWKQLPPPPPPRPVGV